MTETCLQVETLGNCQVSWEGELLSFKTQKSKALLIYLLAESYLRPGIQHSRAKLAELLWPGLPVKSSLENLRQAIYRLKQTLPDTLLAQNFLGINRQYLWIQTSSCCQLDIEDYLRLLQHSTTPEQFLYSKTDNPHFLAHFYLPDNPAFEDWLSAKRDYISQLVVNQIRQKLSQSTEQQQIDILQQELHLWVPEEPLPERPLLPKGTRRAPVIAQGALGWWAMAVILLVVSLVGLSFWKVGEREASKPTSKTLQPAAEAYDWYVKGRAEFFKTNKEGLLQANEYFLKALAINPHYAEAHLQYALALTALSSWWGEGSNHIRDNYPVIQRHLAFVQQNPDLQGNVFQTYGWTNIWRFQLDSAIWNFEKAVEICDCTECVLTGLAHAHFYKRDFDQALQYAKRAQNVNPSFPLNYLVKGEILGVTGRYAEAQEAFQEHLVYAPVKLRGQVRMAWLDLQKGHPRRAIQTLDSLYTNLEEPPYFVIGYLAAAHAIAKQTDEALQLINSMQRLHQLGQLGYAYYIGLTFKLLGEQEQAIQWLKYSLEVEEADSHWVKLEPLLEGMDKNLVFDET